MIEVKLCTEWNEVADQIAHILDKYCDAAFLIVFFTAFIILMYRARKRHKPIDLAALTEACGFRINGRDSRNFTPLMRAAHDNDDDEAVAALVKAGAELNATTDTGITAMMMAARQGNASSLAELICAGADEQLKDAEGNTALMHAILAEQAECVEQFALSGADLNIRHQEGKTALMVATELQKPALVRALFEGDELDKSLRDDHGRTAYDIAVATGNQELISLLK